MKRILKITGWVLLAIIAVVSFCNLWIYSSTKDRVASNMEDIPNARVALVLGTSPNKISGGTNPYFSARMEAAAELYKSGKVSHILVSGDNGSPYYNEPEKMKSTLMEIHGIPPEAITLDHAGFRTLDSIVRCKKVFGENEVIIVTQSFHSYRALFISDYYDMKSWAYVAHATTYGKFQVLLREYLARTLAVWDLYLIHREPKFMGKKETLSL